MGGFELAWGRVSAVEAGLSAVEAGRPRAVPERPWIAPRGAQERPGAIQEAARAIQNGIQNGSKFKTMFKSEKVALQDRLGAVLGRSWAPPASKIVLPPRVALIFSKINFLHKIALGSPTWPPKVPKMTPRWHPKTTPNRLGRPQERPKMAPR